MASQRAIGSPPAIPPGFSFDDRHRDKSQIPDVADASRLLSI
jgi:hypothetical protein